MSKKLLAAFALLATGCASTFHPIDHDTVLYAHGGDTTGVAVQYKYNLLDESGNSLYAKKAREQGLNMVAVKLKNNTARDISVRDNLDFYAGNNVVTPSSPQVMASVHQNSGIYSLYLLLMLINGYKVEGTCDYYNGCREETTFIPIGVIIGPLVTLINVAMSSSANDALVKEAVDNSILEKTLKPGQTASGYLVLRDAGMAPISAKVRN